jgi:hypothetical protein
LVTFLLLLIREYLLETFDCGALGFHAGDHALHHRDASFHAISNGAGLLHVALRKVVEPDWMRDL